ncbi:MAG: class I SAM-dependent methyltransferase, partial [Hydrotalea flava]|nr:class I SAM-dependent methyltransferase [Hydrotalea flava]
WTMVSNDFNPTFRHPLYCIRKGLYNKIKVYCKELTGKLLDFGCGAKPYQSLFSHVETYIGVDYNSGGHTHQNESIDFFYDGETLPFKTHQFDSLFSSEVFEHVFNLEAILPELNRVLKPGGKMLITCPFAWEEHEIPVDYARYTQFALRDLLEKNGFKIIIIDKNGHALSTIHQMLMVYLHDDWLNRVYVVSRFKLFKKIVRQILVPFLNLLFICTEPIWPKNQRLYLNTIVLAEKIGDSL